MLNELFSDAVTNFAPGVYGGIPAKQYFAAHGVSKSDLDNIRPTPAHFRAYKKAQAAELEKPTEAQILGTLFHSSILEPETLKFYTKPEGMNFTTKEGKAWKADHYDLPIVKVEDAEALIGMRESVHSNSLVRKLLDRGKPEQCVFVEHSLGMMRRCRMDLLTEDESGPLVVDFKSTKDVAGFDKDCFDYRYYVQDAYYSDALQDAIFADGVRFLFVVVEKTSPFSVRVVELDKAAKNLGRAHYEQDLQVYAECVAADKWPGYEEKVETISLPRYAFPFEDRQIIVA